MNEDAIVLLGFGGPESRDDVRPFLDRVLRGRTVPPTRYEEVVAHYERIGGASPYNDLTRRQARALAARLHADGSDAPVLVAFRHAEPFVSDVFQQLGAAGARRLIGISMAAHQSEPVSPYIKNAQEALGRLAQAPEIRYAPPFYEHPLFIDAHAARVNEALNAFETDTFDGTALIFSAHSIPRATAAASPYVAQLERSAELIAQRVGAPGWTLAYQSRSGSPREPWLGPDVRDVLRELPQGGVQRAIVVPLGFVCDHVEVLYDLDIDAAQVANDAGVRMQRATGLNDHPAFVNLLAELVRDVR